MKLRILALALSTAVILTASPVVEYTFSQPGDSQASTGSSPAALLLRTGANAAADLTRTAVDGVAGAGDRYLDTQGSAGSYGQHAASLPALAGVSQFTFTGWINTANIGQGGGRIFDLLGGAGGYHLVGQPAGALRLSVDGANADAPAGVLEANTWVFVAVSYDGNATADNVRFFKGTQLADAAEVAVRSLDRGPVNVSATRLTIGKDDGLGSGVFAGLFDNLRIYDRVLEAAEIEAVRGADAPPPPPAGPELLLEYDFSSGAANQPSTGTLPIALTLADAANEARDLTGRSTPGVRGSGDRYLDLVTNPGGYGQHAAEEDAVDALPAFTLSGWINTDSISQAGARLVDNYDNTSGFRLVGQPSGALRLVVDQLNATTGGGFLEPGRWIFFAVTYEGGTGVNNVRFYKGRRDLAVDAPLFIGTIDAGAVGNDSAKFTVGKDRALGGNNFIGRYDNIRLHRGVLDAAEIDALRAADVDGYVEPPELGAVVDVTQAPYYADNTGVTDSTAAIQSALSDNQFKNRTIFFPDGTYRVSRGLFVSTDNVNAGFTHLRGQSRAGTVLRLRDFSDGTAGSENFGDPAQPRVLLNFFVGPWTNNGYYHSVENMTFDTGAGNPGAVALEFQSNNVGWLENVTIRTSDPLRRGVIGLKIDRNLVGMGIARNVSVEGFDYGIRTGHYHASFVFEDVSVAHQRLAGLWNHQKPISLRRFSSENSVPAIINTDPAGQIVLIDSVLMGDNPTVSAIDNEAGYLFARNVMTDGYAGAIRDNGEMVPGDDVTEFVSGRHYTLWPDVPQVSLNLPIADLPIAPLDDPSSVYVVDGTAQDDDTAAIQAAIDSGKTTVFLPLGDYTVSDTISIRGNVRRLLGQQSTLIATQELRNSDKPVLLFEDGGMHPTVWIERIKSNFQPTGRHTWIQHNSSNDLVLRHLFLAYGKAYRNEGTGRLFMEDVATGGANEVMEEMPAFVFKDQQVWAWQFNPEGCLPHVTNDGGSLWVFGFKVGENHGPYFYTVNGGRTELLGGVVNALTYEPQPADRAILINDNSDTFAILVERTRPGSENPTPVVIRELRDLETRELREGDLPRRQADYTRGAVVPFYRGVTPRVDDLPVVSVVPLRDRLEEDAGEPARFGLLASHAVEMPLTVHFTLAGDVTAGADHQMAPASVTFPPGGTQAELQLPVYNDASHEDPERMELRLRGHSSYIVARPFAAATITLHDDELDLERGLIAHYSFSGNYHDSSGAGNHGLPQGTGFETQPDGNVAARFPGGAAHIQLAGTADEGFLHDAFTARSVALRFKADSVAGNQVLLDEGGASHGLGVRIIDGLLEVRTVTFVVPTVVAVPVEAGRWYHVTLTHDRGRVEMYLDGVLVGSAIALRPTTASHRSAGALGLGIGGDVFDDGAGAFAGLMDDVRYYIRVLNDREVRTLAGVARLDHAVAAGDSVSVPFYGEEPGAHGTGLSLTSMGRLTDAQGRTTAFVWRVRNGSGESQAVAVQNANGRSTRSLVVPPHSDTFLATDGLKQPLLHQLRLGQRVLATAFPSDTDFRDDRIVQLE